MKPGRWKKAKSTYEPINSVAKIEKAEKDNYAQYLNSTSITIKNSTPQVYLNIVAVVENQIKENDYKKRGKAINEQIEALGKMPSDATDKKYNQDALTIAISRNLQMKEGQYLIDYIGVLKSYKEIMKEGQVYLDKN